MRWLQTITCLYGHRAIRVRRPFDRRPIRCARCWRVIPGA